MNIHAPERQPNETVVGYKERQATSKAMFKESQRGRKLALTDPSLLFVVQHHATPERKARRDMIKLIGARQYKKLMRGSGL